MYIRREVYFSAWDDMLGEERLFSTTELVPEEDYLDELLFSDDDNPWKGAAVGGGLTAGALGAGAAGAYLGTKGLDKLAKNRGEARAKYIGKNDEFNRFIKSRNTGLSQWDFDTAGIKDALETDYYKKAEKGTAAYDQKKFLEKMKNKLDKYDRMENGAAKTRYKELLDREMKDAGVNFERKLGDTAKNRGRLERYAEKGGKWGHDAYAWMKRNPKLAIAGGLGTVALGTGAGAYLNRGDKKKRR